MFSTAPPPAVMLCVIQSDVFQVTRCTNIAAVKVAAMTELIHTALDSDASARVSGQVGMVTSTSDVRAAASSVELSLTQTVDMEAAKQTATTLLNASASDDDSSSSSVVHLASVPAAVAVIHSGTSPSSLFTARTMLALQALY